MNTNLLYAEGVSRNVTAHDKKSYRQHIFDYVKRRRNLKNKSLLIINRAEIRNRYHLISTLLPACKHHFSVKSCPQSVVINELKNINGKFCVSSFEEINLLVHNNINLNDTIHSHPIKIEHEIALAVNAGITRFVIDNEYELEKFSNFKNQVNLMVRVATTSTISQSKLIEKFGMEPAHTISFIIKATSLGFNISGLCFQVENQMNSNVQFLKALQSCKEIFDECAQIGIHLSVLDIGNGFPFSTSHNYEFFDPINTYLSTRFNGVELIAEPGNFISTPIASIICNVIGKSYRNEKICYYLNNGFCNNIKSLSKELNNFSEVIAYSKFRKSIGDEYVSLVYGSSDDSMDLILEDAYLPEINIGDQLFFDNVGSMGISYSNAFISAETNQIIYLDF